jgi:hypothetical protein
MTASLDEFIFGIEKLAHLLVRDEILLLFLGLDVYLFTELVYYEWLRIFRFCWMERRIYEIKKFLN